jgi:GMP synthase (glutamine-hydrolysing)
MASVLGSRVFAGPVKEIGWGHVELSSDGAASCLSPLGEAESVVLHWHGDTFDLPKDATRLVSNAYYQNQAFAYGRNALGLQFHLEADPRRLEQWYVGHAAELGAAKVSIAELRAATAQVAGRVASQADRIFTCWLREIGAPA